MPQSIAAVIAKCVALVYGLLALGVAVLYSLSRADTWRQTTEEEKQAFETVSDQLWDLSQKDNDLSHKFLELRNGLQMHYLSTKFTPREPKNLIIFLHGFPDTCYLWEQQLRSDLASKAKLVALDLPGCGGSDSHSSYGPDQILNDVAEAIVKLKLRYLHETTPPHTIPSKKKTVLVSHDWGGVIAYRLAGETSALVDEVVVFNSTYMRATKNQVASRLGLARDAIYAGRLSDAWSQVQPIYHQLLKSHYIFMLNLRLPLARWMPWLATSLVKLCHEFAYRNTPQATGAIYNKSLAASYGPSLKDCFTHTPSAEPFGPDITDPDTEIEIEPIATYGTTVCQRSEQNPRGDWDERVRIYCEGLALGKWHPSYFGYQEPLSKSDPERAARKGQFNYPMHVMFGMQDVALDPRIVLEGLESWMQDAEEGLRKPQVGSEEGVEVQAVGRSSITKLWRCGHWATLDAQGSRVLVGFLEGMIGASR